LQGIFGGNALGVLVCTLREQVAVAGVAPAGTSGRRGGLVRLVGEGHYDVRTVQIALRKRLRLTRCCCETDSTDDSQTQKAGVHNGAHYDCGPRDEGATGAPPEESSPGMGSTQRTRGSARRRADSRCISWLTCSGMASALATTLGAIPKIPLLSGPSTIRAPVDRNASSAAPTVTERSKA